MPKSTGLSGCLDEIDLEFVERESTPRLLMKLSIQLHLAESSISNTVSFLEVFGVESARSTVHNWVHKDDLQPDAGRSPDHVAVDETVIQLNDQRYCRTLPSIPIRTNYFIQSLNRPERT